MPRIMSIYAFVTEETPGVEGLAAFRAEGVWYPMVAADKSRVERLKVRAQEIANMSGRRVRLVHFKVRKDLDIIDPETH